MFLRFDMNLIPDMRAVLLKLVSERDCSLCNFLSAVRSHCEGSVRWDTELTLGKNRYILHIQLTFTEVQ